MDFSQTFAICAAGMASERTRVEVATINLANANTIQTADGVSYQPLRVLVRSMSAGAMLPNVFADRIEAGLSDSAPSVRNLSLPQVLVEPSPVEPRQVYEPDNPFANTKGFVVYPGVDTATEMMNMMSALRSYEANVAAMNVTKTMALKALEIGGAS